MNDNTVKPEISNMLLRDVTELSKLETACFSSPWSEASLISELSNDRALFLVAKMSGEIVGYIGSHLIAEECYITNVAVFPTHRRCGVASSLIKALCLTLEEKNADFVSLEVRESNSGAISLYEKLGFSCEGKIKSMYENPCEDALIYTLIINRRN